MELNDPTHRSFKDYLIPYYKCVFNSTLAKEEIVRRINSRTEAEKMFRRRGLLASNKVSKEYEGEVATSSFEISRINKRKKSNAAVLIGDLSSSNQYTTVKIKMRLNLILLAILPIWILVFSRMFFKNGDFLSIHTEFDFATILPLVFALFVYISITASFHYNLTKDFKFLKEVIEPVDVNTSGASWITRN